MRNNIRVKNNLQWCSYSIPSNKKPPIKTITLAMLVLTPL